MTIEANEILRKELFEISADHERKSLNLFSGPTLPIDPSQKNELIFIVNHGKLISMMITNLEMNGQEIQWVYPDESQTAASDFINNYNIFRLLKQSGDNRLINQGEIRNSRTITTKTLSEMMLGNKITFYVGSGMSHSGNSPVMDYAELYSNWGIVDKPPGEMEGEDFEKNAVFIERLQSDQSYAESVMGLFGKFINTFYVNESTPAHLALAQMVRLLKYEPKIITTNHDMKILAGEGVNYIKINSGWNILDKKPNWDLLDIIERSEIIVALGVANDNKGLLGEFRKLHPDFPIIALNLNTGLPYLGSNDYMIQGDCQELLPQLLEELTSAHEIRQKY